MAARGSSEADAALKKAEVKAHEEANGINVHEADAAIKEAEEKAHAAAHNTGS